MRILYVSPHFPPDLGALATRVHELTRRWAAEGHEVHVLCGLPHHPHGRVPEAYRGRGTVHEEVDGVHVHRAWLYAAANRGLLKRSLGFLSFALSTLLVGRRLPRPDVVISTSPQFLSGLAGALLAKWLRVPLVVEIRDLWPRSIWEVGALKRDSLVIRALEVLERWLYRAADRLVVVTETFQEEILEKVPRDPADLALVTNGVDFERFDPVQDDRPIRARLGVPEEAFVALYAGTHGMAHGLDTVVEAARRTPEAHFVLVGDGACKADLMAEGRDVDNLQFLDAQPAEAMPALYAMADVCLVPLRDLPVFRTVIPSKIFEIWAMERPVILGVEGEARRIVEAAGGGIPVAPEDPVALAAAVRKLGKDPELRAALGAAGRFHARRFYDRDLLAARFLHVLADAAGQGEPPPTPEEAWAAK